MSSLASASVPRQPAPPSSGSSPASTCRCRCRSRDSLQRNWASYGFKQGGGLGTQRHRGQA